MSTFGFGFYIWPKVEVLSIFGLRLRPNVKMQLRSFADAEVFFRGKRPYSRVINHLHTQVGFTAMKDIFLFYLGKFITGPTLHAFLKYFFETLLSTLQESYQCSPLSINIQHFYNSICNPF
jgi:hypothetical protein